MKEQKAIVDVLENELYAEISKRDLEVTGIGSNMLEEDMDLFILFSDQAEGVQLVMPGNQIEKQKITEDKISLMKHV